MKFDQSKRILASRQTGIFIATLILMLLVNHLTFITTNAQTPFDLQREKFERNQRFQKILEQVNGNEKIARQLFERNEMENYLQLKVPIQSDSKTAPQNATQNSINDGGALDATFAPKIESI
ncbi:MAG: hypothetical protein H7Z37_09215, partial [Pyrinomonadaceae bacterium]|nr:hypothetical protein [Pyrinomonadaceae bacterium]